MEAPFHPASPVTKAAPGIRGRLVRAAAALVLCGAAAALAQTPQASLEALRDRARTILQRIHDRELSAGEARPLVERLRQDLVALGEAQGWQPTARRLEITITEPGEIGPQLAEACPLFFEEELVRFCPLDPSRSAIWGDQVVVCEFVCAPGDAPPAPGPADRR